MNRRRKIRGMRDSIKRKTVINPTGHKYMKGGDIPKYFHGGIHDDPTKPWEIKTHSTQEDYPGNSSNQGSQGGFDFTKENPFSSIETPNVSLDATLNTDLTLGSAAPAPIKQAGLNAGSVSSNAVNLPNFSVSDVSDYQSKTIETPDFSTDSDFMKKYGKKEGDSEDEVEQPEDTHLFNPYAGVDTMSAMNILGQGFGKPKEERTTEDKVGMWGAGAKVITSLGRSFMSGMGHQKRNQFAVNDMNKKRRSGMISDSVEMAAEGGSISNPMQMGIDNGEENEDMMTALLTGDYSTGTKTGPANVEVERGEYIKAVDGNVTKVLGDTHAEGGEAMNVEEGTQVISNQLRLTPDQVTRLKDEYGIKASTKDSYAKAMDKYYKSIGLQDLIDEEEGVIEEIKKQTEKSREQGADESTLGLNLEFLSSKEKELSEAKAPLQQQAASFFDEIFKLQESSKPAQPKQTTFKFGGTVYTEEDIREIAKNNDIDVKRAFELVQKFSDGGTKGDPDLQKTERERFKKWVDHVRKYGFKGDVNVDADDLGAEAGKIQQWMVKNHPEAVVRYFKSNPITSKGIKSLQASPKGKEVFEAAGVDIKKAPGQLTAEERVALQNAAREAGAVDRSFILDQFQDNMWDFRSPNLELRSTPSNIQGIPAAAAPIDTDKPVLPELNFDFSKDHQPTQKQVDKFWEEHNEKFGQREDIQADPTKDTSNIYLLPDQTVLPPTGMQPHLLGDVRLGRIDPNLISPDAQLAELERNTAAALKEVNKLPSGQREAAIAQIMANKEKSTNEITFKTEVANKDRISRAEAFNIRQADREEESRLANLLNYEQRALTALGNTEDDFRRYFNEQQSRNVQNFNAIASLDLMNQMNENYNITSRGIEFTGSPGLNEQYENQLYFAQAMPKDTQTTTKKKKSRGRSK